MPPRPTFQPNIPSFLQQKIGKSRLFKALDLKNQNPVPLATQRDGGNVSVIRDKIRNSKKVESFYYDEYMKL